MRIGGWKWPAVAGLACCAGAVLATGPTKAPPVAVVADFPVGQWQLREVGSTQPAKAMCIADADVLIQLKHPGLQCTRFVIDDSARTATLHYTCPGAGHGRTTIKLESRKAFHLDTQGVAGGSPFDTGYDATRIGDCPTAAR